MSIKQNKYSKHFFFMRLALFQAKKNLGNTLTNPAVGCVIVNNNGLISAGCTGINGRPHAEQNAINFSKKNIKNSTMYVTLEPCSHYGKTPPCVDTIIKNKIKKVHFAIKDPDIRSYDKSSKRLRKNNIVVKNNVYYPIIKEFYKSYYKFKKSNTPFVVAKMAISKDYYTNNKKRKLITNAFSRSRANIIRSNFDCLLTSSKTIIDDNPRLTCRIPGLERRTPTLIVLDKNLKVPVSSRIFKLSYKHNIIIFFNKMNIKKFKILKKFKIKLIKMSLNKDGRLDLKKIVEKIKFLGFSRILLESGLNLTTNFLNDNLVDEFKLFISNKKIRRDGNKSLKKVMKLFLNRKKFVYEKVNLFGDLLLTYRIK